MFNVVEFFSGIGAQAKAFERVREKYKFDFKISATCEWDVHPLVAYDYIHLGSYVLDSVYSMTREEVLKELGKYTFSNDGKKPMQLKTLKLYSTDVLKQICSSRIKSNNLVDIEKVHGKDLPEDISMLTYSFPCQDLSNVGALHGYNKGIDRSAHTRSGLLWEVERILQERIKDNLKLPKYLLLENVTALQSPRHNKNFVEWQNELESMGYISKIYCLQAIDLGVPQNRERLLMLSVLVKSNDKKEQVLEFLNQNDLKDPKVISRLNFKQQSLKDIIDIKYNDKELLQEALECQPNDTTSRQRMWRDNNKIFSDEDGRIEWKDKVQTITTKQDRYPNSGDISFRAGESNKSTYRFLTPRECFRLMGFDEEDYVALKNAKLMSRKNAKFFSRDKLYRLAGNSIVVQMLEAVFSLVVELEQGILKDGE